MPDITDQLTNPFLSLPQFISGMRVDDMESDKTLNLFSFNVDFALNYADVNNSVDSFLPHADYVGFQEAKNVRIGKVCKDIPSISVYQDSSSDSAKRGSAIAVRLNDSRTFQTHGLFLLTPRARDLLARYGLYGTLTIAGVKPVTILDFHAPPKRDWELDAILIRNLAKWYEANRSIHRSMVISADWNLHDNDTIWRKIMGALPGMKIGISGGIDKILVSNDIQIKRKWIGPRTKSDHRPVACTAKLAEK